MIERLIKQQRTATSPLSFAQERLWILEQLELVGAAYNMTAAFQLEGNLNVSALRAALRDIVRRHEALRTRIELLSGEGVQRTEDSTEFELSIFDLRNVQPESALI